MRRLALALVLAIGCTRSTHANDWAVAGTSASDSGSDASTSGACSVCPATHEDLRHVPCPIESTAPDLDEIFVYAIRSMKLGQDASTWRGAQASSFEMGLDQDCSTRPNGGHPVACAPRLSDEAGVDWEALPHGIDNALAQRIINPLYVKGGGVVDLEKKMADQIAAGGGTIVWVVSGWNGTPDDPRVELRMVSASNISPGNGPPRWDGTDQWDVYADVPTPDHPGLPGTRILTTDAYVRGGLLVADMRRLDAVPTTQFNGDAKLELRIHDVIAVAHIDRSALHGAYVTGIFDLSEVLAQTHAIAQFLAACDPGLTTILDGYMPDLFAGAADLPTPRGNDPKLPCNAISLAWGGDASRIRLGRILEFVGVTAGCKE